MRGSTLEVGTRPEISTREISARPEINTRPEASAHVGGAARLGSGARPEASGRIGGGGRAEASPHVEGGARLDVSTRPDGSVVIQPHGSVGPGEAVELRQLLVYMVRRVRPMRLIIDLAHVRELDPINLGSVVAARDLGDDHQVAVFLDNPSGPIAAQLRAAGVPAQRVRSA